MRYEYYEMKYPKDSLLISLKVLKVQGIHTEMKHQCLSSDIISILPQNIIDYILCLMPIQDALRTSILCRKWRYCWMSMPELAFDDKTFQASSIITQLKKHKFVNAIFHVLLLHRGPILKFTLSVSELEIESEIHQIILHLSRSTHLQEFTLNMHTKCYKLPYSVLSLQDLYFLRLVNSQIGPPLIFNGFSRLKCLLLINIVITAIMLQCLLTNCPLLRTVALVGCQEEFLEGYKFTFVELFECLPSVLVLQLSKFYVKCFATGAMPPKLSTSRIHLRDIYLEVCFMEQHELLWVLYLIRSSPKLKRIDLTMNDNHKPHVQQASMNFYDLQDYSGINLDHLNELRIRNFGNVAHEMAFVKLIMAKSPVLKKVKIVLSPKVSVDDELKMFRDLLRFPLQRASPEAQFTIVRP